MLNKVNVNKRNLHKVLSINEAARDINKHTTVVSDDTLNRREINETILKEYRAGKNREEILDILNTKFSDSKYDKYRVFFDKWVCDRLGIKQESHDEER